MASNNAKFGFVEFAEKWNGRMAMLGFTVGLAAEAFKARKTVAASGGRITTDLSPPVHLNDPMNISTVAVGGARSESPEIQVSVQLSAEHCVMTSQRAGKTELKTLTQKPESVRVQVCRCTVSLSIVHQVTKRLITTLQMSMAARINQTFYKIDTTV
eukprot:g5279.t1